MKPKQTRAGAESDQLILLFRFVWVPQDDKKGRDRLVLSVCTAHSAAVTVPVMHGPTDDLYLRSVGHTEGLGYKQLVSRKVKLQLHATR
jgi:hypothetical protein